MKRRPILAAGGATLALALITSTVALAAAGPKVTVRIEGRTRALLAPTLVRTRTGSITHNGAPRGACPETSAAGVLDTAAHHRWSGTFGSFGIPDYFITSILGDTEKSKAYYWGIWIDNRFATTGACEIKLHSGDRLLFAVDSISHHEHPLNLTGPAVARVGHSFSVKVVSFSDSGVAKPLRGAHVRGAGPTATTNSHGVATLTATHTGTLALRADRSGYIRAAPLSIRVTL